MLSCAVHPRRQASRPETIDRETGNTGSGRVAFRLKEMLNSVKIAM